MTFLFSGMESSYFGLLGCMCSNADYAALYIMLSDIIKLENMERKIIKPSFLYMANVGRSLHQLGQEKKEDTFIWMHLF